MFENSTGKYLIAFPQTVKMRIRRRGIKLDRTHDFNCRKSHFSLSDFSDELLGTMI
jgi:hypothetical protein